LQMKHALVLGSIHGAYRNGSGKRGLL